MDLPVSRRTPLEGAIGINKRVRFAWNVCNAGQSSAPTHTTSINVDGDLLADSDETTSIGSTPRQCDSRYARPSFDVGGNHTANLLVDSRYNVDKLSETDDTSMFVPYVFAK